MRTRQLGASGLELTTIGLGTWAIGGGDWKFGWGQQDEAEAVAAIHRAVELGVNWVDTAPVYGVGRSEEIVGRALRELPPGARPLVATKLGRINNPDGSITPRLEADSIRRECDESLRRLGVEAIDLYQMHWPEPDADIEAGWEAMEGLRRAGKVRHIGVCNYSVSQLRRVGRLAPVVSLQPPYSMLRRETEDELLPYCGQHRIGVVAYSPMGKGLLTGKFTPARAASLEPSDHRTRDPNFLEPRLSVHLELVDGLQRIAAEAGRDAAQLAIAWVLRRPEVTSAIVGARNPRQIDQTAAAGDWELSAAEASAIDGLLTTHAAALATLPAA
ncbi:MAG TPA: aldo/keto reductase [Lacipirellulaceae bacterium]|nr:aldo/keto reductase [Lacipirellulaceae bacterium]